jgi:hypothetical protein
MVERQVQVDNYVLNYEGIFNLKDLYSLIDNFADKNGFTKKEISTGEIVKQDGRNANLVFEIWRQLSDYAKTVIKVRLVLENVKDVIVEKEGYKNHMNQGKVKFVLYAYVETDFEHKWENTPGFFFVRILFDKYIFKPFTTNYPSIVMSDFAKFRDELRAFLNLNKY